MALDFLSNPAGLLPRLGRILHIAYINDVFQATLPAAFTSLENQYLTSLQQVIGPVSVSADGLVRVGSNVMAFATAGQGQFNAAWDTIVNMVLSDQPSQSWTRQSAMAEVVRQMKAQSIVVKKNTITLTPTALSGSVGTGVLVTTTLRADGLVQENTIAETLRLVCTQDSYTGSATVGQEQFSLVGAPILGGTWDYDYPTGSATGVQVNAIAASQTATSTGNIFTNSDFEDWSSDPAPVLSNYVLQVGTWGTNIKQDAMDSYQGTYDVEWVAGTGNNTALYQLFGDSTGTTITPTALSSVAHNIFLKRAGVVTAGVLTVELVSSSGTVINDAQGVPNSTTITCSGLTTSYVSHSVVFRLPNNPPTTMWFRYRMSTALTGANIRMDSAALAQMNAMYTGGPAFVVFSGATPFVGGDGWSVVNGNDQGGATFCATFQTGFQRLFDFRSLGLLLPSNTTPTVGAENTLITS